MGREICIPCPDNNRDFEAYFPSPLEAAFNAEIRKRFKTSLNQPSINKDSQLVRISRPVVIGNQMLTFLYKRMDPLKVDSPAIVAFGQDLQPDEMRDSPEGQDDIRIIESIRQRVIRRDGKFSPVRALTDPNYYSCIETVTRWPEQFDFVIADKKSIADSGKSGTINKANIHGSLSMFLNLEGYDTFPSLGEGEFIVTYPKLFNRIFQSYRAAYKEGSEKLIRGLNSTRASYFPNIRGIRMPVCLSAKIKSPEDIMSEFAIFAQELCH